MSLKRLLWLMAELVFVFACSCAAPFCALLKKQALAPQQVCFVHLLLLHACNVAYRTVLFNLYT